MPAPHPPEFRRRAVEPACLGEQPVAAIAKDLGISESCLRNWMAQADADDGHHTDRLTGRERAELAELRKDKRRLEVENESAEAARPRLPGSRRGRRRVDRSTVATKDAAAPTAPGGRRRRRQ